MKFRVILVVHLCITTAAVLRYMESHLGDMDVRTQAIQGYMLMSQVSYYDMISHIMPSCISNGIFV